MTRPRILIITRNLPPLVGGMERLNWHMANELAKYAEVQVIGPRGAKQEKPRSVRLDEAPLKPLALFFLVALLKGFWRASRWKPDTILAGSGLTAPLAWILSKLTRSQSASYLHGFDITAANPVYRLIWRPTFKWLDHVIVNSTPTQDLAIAAGVCRQKLQIVHPGVTIPNSPPSLERISAFKTKHKLEGKKILLSVGRLTARKGLRKFVEQALPSIKKSEPDTMLVVIGAPPQNSLGAETESIGSIKAQAKASGVEENILFLGIVEDSDLATAYQAADIHVFPVRHMPDVPEGFGMVAIEAASHGLPTIAFATGGIIDAVSDGVSGYLVEPNNYPQFSQQVLKTLKQPLDPQSIFNFAQRFKWLYFGEAILSGLTLNERKSERHAQLPDRLPHVVTDLESRVLKAQKIELLLKLNTKAHPNPLRLLEVGCGSGGIAHYFATKASVLCEVTAVDIHDNRKVLEGYKFQKVHDIILPFPDESFDLAITNHVIEHVGDREAQLQHLRELNRILAPGGICYLAVPNRWMLTEPHYKLKFLSWLPGNMRSPYLRWSGKGEHYDCEPLSLKQLESMLNATGFMYENISVPATRVTFELEKPDSPTARFLALIPDSALSLFKPLIPTLIYRIKRGNEDRQ